MSSRNRIIPIYLFAVIMAVPAIVHAQGTTPEVPSFTIRANTRMVMVDVVVTDKKGQPITGLKAEDFTMEENGKKQKIATFLPPGADQKAPQPLPAGLLTNRPEYLKPAGVPTVLLLDANNSHFLDQAYGRGQMLKYVLEQSEAGAPMAVMTLTDRLRVLQDFTSDPKILTTAIRKLQPQEPILQSMSAPAQTNVEPGLRSSSANVPVSPGGQFAELVAISQAQVESFQNQAAGYALERRTLITIQAMRDLSRALGGLPGRKNVVWLTADFPFDLIPEDTNKSDAEVLADLPSMANVRNDAINNAAGNGLSQQRALHNQEIRQAQFALASSGIAVYPVDMRGIMASGIDVNSTSSLQELAKETGGKAYVNQNEIKNGIALAVSDEKASYELGYYPENKKWDGKFRSLKVKLDQGDREIRYRKGYFALDPAQVKNPNFESDVAEAMEFHAPATQVSFMAQAKPTDPGKVRVVFLVDAHTLSADDSGGGKKMNVSLYASAYNANGKNLGTRTIKVDRVFDSATYQQILDKGMMVPIDMELPAGAKQLRLAVLDNKTGSIGTATGAPGN
ncbi:MAG: VWA domain-containing protein [Acidobacteriia bacterium]|nr:VWA domain-containing protein [Terriglobia bacterium]